jgi:hypothetical protein
MHILFRRKATATSVLMGMMLVLGSCSRSASLTPAEKDLKFSESIWHVFAQGSVDPCQTMMTKVYSGTVGPNVQKHHEDPRQLCFDADTGISRRNTDAASAKGQFMKTGEGSTDFGMVRYKFSVEAAFSPPALQQGDSVTCDVLLYGQDGAPTFDGILCTGPYERGGLVVVDSSGVQQAH